MKQHRLQSTKNKQGKSQSVGINQDDMSSLLFRILMQRCNLLAASMTSTIWLELRNILPRTMRMASVTARRPESCRQNDTCFIICGENFIGLCSHVLGGNLGVDLKLFCWGYQGGAPLSSSFLSD